MKIFLQVLLILLLKCLYKVIKLRSPESIGKSVLVQGGTFYNESVLRAFEQETGIKAIRPDIAGLMGAFGIALIARERYQGQGTTLLNKEQVDASVMKVQFVIVKNVQIIVC